MSSNVHSGRSTDGWRVLRNLMSPFVGWIAHFCTVRPPVGVTQHRHGHPVTWPAMVWPPRSGSATPEATSADPTSAPLATPPEPTSAGDPGPGPKRRRLPERLTGWPHRVEVLVVIAVVLAGLVARFVARSPLWLDEALTVNIARLPLGQIPSWLRHDGHPPLYYLLLHGWTDVFGTSDEAVRALSGVFGVALMPLMYVAGRRLGGRACAWACVVVLALSPYAVRYSTETRMYSLVMVLVLAAWLIGTDALQRPKPWRLVVLAALAGLLLWSHYWGMWLLAAAGIALLWQAVQAHRRGDRSTRDNVAKVLGALVVGALTFVPWLPSMLYQSAHTGTPWARPSAPTAILAQSIADFGGGARGEQVVLGWLLCMVALLGVFARPRDRRHLEIDLHTRPEARRLAYLIVATLIIAAVFSYAANSGFATRYDAVWFPFFVLLVGLGITRFLARWALRGVLAVLLVLGAVGVARVMFQPTRSEARVAAVAIASRAQPGDVVVTCPDQLGPALDSELQKRIPAGSLVEGTFPRFASPKLVDWVDYQARVDAEEPQAFAQEVLRRAGDHQIFLAWAGSYRTHVGICEAVVNALLTARPTGGAIVKDSSYYFEHEAVMFFPSPGEAQVPRVKG